MKKTQNIFFIATMLIVMSTMIGCDNGDDYYLVTGEPTVPVVIHVDDDNPSQQQPDNDTSVVTNPVVDDPVDDGTDSTSDWYDIYRVSEDWAKTYTGAYLEKDEFLYSLNDASSSKVYANCNVGWRRDELGVTGLYSYADMQFKHIFACGDFDTPVYNDGDVVKSFKNTKLTFKEVKQVGYGVPLVTSSNAKDDWGYIPSFGSSDVKTLNPMQLAQLSVTCNGNEVENYFDMEKNGDVIISWFEGTDYKEVSFKANCRIYEIVSDAEPIVIEGELNKEGYATYDMSVLPKGTYWINETCGMITVE